jgi:hypothetical protein
MNNVMAGWWCDKCPGSCDFSMTLVCMQLEAQLLKARPVAAVQLADRPVIVICASELPRAVFAATILQSAVRSFHSRRR